MAVTRQQLEQQLVAAHRTKNVQAAQQAAYAIRAYDQNVLSAQVPSINAPPPIDRVPKPTFGSYIEDISRGMGRGFVTQLEGMQQLVTHPYDTGKALIQAGVEAVRNPSQAIGEAWSGIKSQAQTAMSSPEGFGRVLGENLDFIPGPGGKRLPTMAELDVYHGTPHTLPAEPDAPLGRFRSEKIGTGEGAQSYGYGLYLTESPDVGITYRNPGGPRGGTIPIDIDGVAAGRWSQKPGLSPVEARAADAIARTRNPDFAIEYLKQDAGYSKTAAEAIDWIKQNRQRFSDPGNLYKVDLPDAKIEKMLDWDKPLSQQPKIVKDAFKKAFTNSEIADDELRAWYQNNPDPTGNALYSQLMTSDMFTGNGSKEASRVLSEFGVPGIKHLDAASLSEGKKTRNFVVFPGEEQSLTILERDGVKAEVPKAVAPKFDLSADSAKGIRETKVGNTQISYEYDGNMASIASIRTPSGKRNQGSARAAMEQFLAETDALGIPVKLESSPLDKRTTDARLFNFYKSLGFEPTGRKINAVGDPEMIRQPRTN